MMRTNGCKNWRCRDYGTTMVLHCARSISKTDSIRPELQRIHAARSRNGEPCPHRMGDTGDCGLVRLMDGIRVDDGKRLHDDDFRVPASVVCVRDFF